MNQTHLFHAFCGSVIEPRTVARIGLDALCQTIEVVTADMARRVAIGAPDILFIGLPCGTSLRGVGK